MKLGIALASLLVTSLIALRSHYRLWCHFLDRNSPRPVGSGCFIRYIDAQQERFRQIGRRLLPVLVKEMLASSLIPIMMIPLVFMALLSLSVLLIYGLYTLLYIISLRL